MTASKISIAIDEDLLALARRTAEHEGTSLSAFVSRAVRRQLEEEGRLEAARRLHASWGRDAEPTSEQRAAFHRAMARPRKRRRSAA